MIVVSLFAGDRKGSFFIYLTYKKYMFRQQKPDQIQAGPILIVLTIAAVSD